MRAASSYPRPWCRRQRCGLASAPMEFSSSPLHHERSAGLPTLGLLATWPTRRWKRCDQGTAMNSTADAPGRKGFVVLTRMESITACTNQRGQPDLELKNNLTLQFLLMTCVPLMNGHPMLAATVRNYMMMGPGRYTRNRRKSRTEPTDGNPTVDYSHMLVTLDLVLIRLQVEGQLLFL